MRQLIHSRLVVESFADESGGIHSRLHEDLEVQVRHQTCSVFMGFLAYFGSGITAVVTFFLLPFANTLLRGSAPYVHTYSMEIRPYRTLLRLNRD